MKLEPLAFCEAFWRGKTRRFALALSEGYIHFWEPDSAEFQTALEEWVWVVQGAIRVGQNAVVNPRFLEVVFRPALGSDGVGRLLNISKWHNVFVGARGNGEICAPSSQHRLTSFMCAREEDFFSLTASWWRDQISAWESQRDSDFHRAHSWHLLNDEQRSWRLTLLSQGNWDELNRVAQLALMLECADCSTEVATQDQLRLWIVNKNGEFSWRLQEDRDPDFPQHNTLRRQLWDAWFQWFNPHLNTDLMRLHMAANRHIPHTFRFMMKAKYDPSSAHEQLELRLQLRDWLRDRVGLSDERIAQLLG